MLHELGLVQEPVKPTETSHVILRLRMVIIKSLLCQRVFVYVYVYISVCLCEYFYANVSLSHHRVLDGTKSACYLKALALSALKIILINLLSTKPLFSFTSLSSSWRS